MAILFLDSEAWVVAGQGLGRNLPATAVAGGEWGGVRDVGRSTFLLVVQFGGGMESSGYYEAERLRRLAGLVVGLTIAPLSIAAPGPSLHPASMTPIGQERWSGSCGPRPSAGPYLCPGAPLALPLIGI